MHTRASTSVLVQSLAILTLVTETSVLGLVDQSTYGEKKKNWVTQARGLDIGNLVAVVILSLGGYGYSERFVSSGTRVARPALGRAGVGQRGG